MEATRGFSASTTQYHVFLSFRGPDTRHTFTDCLYRTMVAPGIVVYRDSEELHAGDRIDDLLRAVSNSKICIPVLSRGYASSPWCLRELALMVELNESTGKPEILPIFFDVRASDVKLKTKLYAEDLEKHEQRPGEESREQWEAALRKVGEIKGWEVQGKAHGEVIDLVVKEVLHKLKVKQRPLDSKPIGVDAQVEAIMKLLDVDSGTGVRFVGIHGMGGIGKTTLAKIVFNELCHRFDGQCSFIGDIRESSNTIGLVNLQKQLASDISKSRSIQNFGNTDEGIDSITRIAGSKKVLVVLDDLDNTEQLNKLAGSPDTFCTGSRIIITTRDQRILAEEKGILAYEVNHMDHDKALELFSWHAFDSISPPDAFQSFSRGIVSTTGGLPLALKVIGSSLHCKEIKIWKEMQEKLKKVPHNEVRDMLKISYEGLGDMEKEIFLDIACFFINEKKSRATYFWKACDLYPHTALEELTNLCLIKIVNGDAIWMHDQLRDLGRDIVRQECTRNLTGCSRLWNGKEALKVVRSKKRKDEVKALNLVEGHSNPISIVDEELERMPSIKFLKLRAATFVGNINNYLLELRWLSWDSPPLDCKMANLHLKNLVVFELSRNENTENWGGWNILKMAKKLKVLSLLRCEGLKRTPDFSRCLGLERLSLDSCSNLQEVDSSIGKLNDLTHLDIIRCTSLRNLPKDIGELVNLKHLSLGECSQMEKLPYFIGKLTSLSELDISCSKITSLPDSIGNAKHLSFLDLSVTLIAELPNSIGELTQLKVLSLFDCQNLGELPESIGNLTSLQNLDLSGTNIVKLPDSLKNLKQLKVMRMRWSPIRRLPAGIGMLERLEELYAYRCEQLAGELPTEIGKLSSLKILDISHTLVSVVPKAINSLTQLQKLDLTDCNELQELPKLPSSLNCLRVQSTSLQLVPNLGSLTNLVELDLYNGFGQAMPMQTHQLQWVEKLSKLEKLSWGLSGVSMPSAKLGCLSLLRELTLSGMNRFDSVVVGPQFSNLKNLSRLCLYRCPLREIQLNGLELLRYLSVNACEFLERLSIISSSLRKLHEMGVSGCPKLHEIQILSTMESLEELRVECCDSLGRLWGLPNLKKLKTLEIIRCDGLRVIEGLEELALLHHLRFEKCGSLEMLTNVSNSQISNECRIYVWHCAKLPDTNCRFFSYGNYRKMVLDWTRKTFIKEDEMEKNDRIDCTMCILDCICKPLSFFQERSLRRQAG